jgi:hypothetical protein
MSPPIITVLLMTREETVDESRRSGLRIVLASGLDGLCCMEVLGAAMMSDAIRLQNTAFRKMSIYMI